MNALDESSFERLINIQSYTDEELKALHARLTEEEREISMRRRLLHAELDILRAETVRRLRDRNKTEGGLVRDGDLAVLTDILSGRGFPSEDAGEER
ncbi:MAG: hypothetical protein LLG45_04575 [Actinomycetia bacterium]|nr:hypothetical protein [Actinomycetes bacterium]